MSDQARADVAAAHAGSGASRVDGRVILLNGGTQGLGAATARLLAERGAAGLVLAGRSRTDGEALAEELDSATTKAIFIEADLSDPEAVAGVLAATDEAFGVVHGLVNIAANTERGDIWNTDVALWDRIMNLNLRTPFLMLQGVARIMVRENVAGSVVTIGSMTGHGGQHFLFPYAVSKGALHTFTKNSAYALMRQHIRVNLLNLGWMDTPNEHSIQVGFHKLPEDWLVAAEAAQPFGRLIKPIEAARVITFLLSDESGMMTGVSLDYDQAVQGAGDAPKPPANLNTHSS
jgi:NAD(P)-dependent dehydrogenase (short-subunit alcohol dehydrogenase family)